MRRKHNFSAAIPPRSDLDWCDYLRREGFLGEALERCLHDIGVLHPGGWADWQPSTMTDTGAPVEMLFTGHQSALALRTEVDDPATDPTGRVDRVCGLIKQLGGVPPDAGLRDVISVGQSAGALQFGAWLGLQRCETKLATTLFAEMPQGASDLIPLLASNDIRPTLAHLGDKITPTMLAYEALTGDVSLHFDTPCTPADIVPDLVVPAQATPTFTLDDIQVMIEAGIAFGHTPSCDLSFSYTMHRDGSAPTLTVFVSAKGMFGNDQTIEAMVRGYSGNHMGAYAGLVDHLPKTAHGQTHHGKIGLRANGPDCPTLSLGVAAPWAYPGDPV